jgi:hypothetical protein
MRSQEQAFRSYYASMTDAELLKISENRNSFISLAQRILTDEMEKRHLMPSKPQPQPVRHSALWNWGNHLFQAARRLHHHPASP